MASLQRTAKGMGCGQLNAVQDNKVAVSGNRGAVTLGYLAARMVSSRVQSFGST